jgi:hypothetical protein
LSYLLTHYSCYCEQSIPLFLATKVLGSAECQLFLILPCFFQFLHLRNSEAERV